MYSIFLSMREREREGGREGEREHSHTTETRIHIHPVSLNVSVTKVSTCMYSYPLYSMYTIVNVLVGGVRVIHLPGRELLHLSRGSSSTTVREWFYLPEIRSHTTCHIFKWSRYVHLYTCKQYKH